MAKRRGRQVSLDGLVKKISGLDRQRVALQNQLKEAITRTLGGGVPAPFSYIPGLGGTRRRGRPAGSTKTKGTQKRRKMSKAARAKIAAAQRARWAKQKAAAK